MNSVVKPYDSQILGKYIRSRNTLDKPIIFKKDGVIGFGKGNGSINRHRNKLPAYITEYPNIYNWYRYSRRHNPYGPAMIFRNGKFKYFLDGVEKTKGQWEVQRLNYIKEIQ